MEYKAVFLYVTLSWILYLHTATSNPLHLRGDRIIYRINRDTPVCDPSKGTELRPDGTCPPNTELDDNVPCCLYVCDNSKGHFNPTSDGKCGRNTEFVVDVNCCVTCIVSCPIGKRKATSACHAACVDCGVGTFNDKQDNRDPRCEPCDESCDDLLREYSQPCTLTQNAKCGRCLDGHFAAASQGNNSQCHACFEESDNPTCISYYNKQKLKQLTTILVVSIVGGILLLGIVIVVAVCAVRKVKAKRSESKRRLSTRNNHELDTLVNKDKDANTSTAVDIPDSKAGKPSSHEKITHGVQTGESLRYTGNGGDEKKQENRVTFGPDPERKKKGILKVDVSRRPGDGQPAPPVSVDPTPSATLDTKSPRDFSSTPWWLTNNTSGQSPNDSMVSNDVFLDGKNTPVPPTPEYESAYPGWKPPSLASCVSRQSSNFQSLPSDPDE